jgi:hypothetical protein
MTDQSQARDDDPQEIATEQPAPAPPPPFPPKAKIIRSCC